MRAFLRFIRGAVASNEPKPVSAVKFAAHSTVFNLLADLSPETVVRPVFGQPALRVISVQHTDKMMGQKSKQILLRSVVGFATGTKLIIRRQESCVTKVAHRQNDPTTWKRRWSGGMLPS